MKKLILIGATLLLGGCVAVPYGGDQYSGGYSGAGYYAPAPVYVAPSVDVGFGYWGGGWRGH